MEKVSLTKQVEDIVFSRSALPEVLTSEKLCGILRSLERRSGKEPRGSGRRLFGAESISAKSSSFLVSQGCPAHTRVKNSFVAAAAHSELGKMLQWFASAVVALFVDGVRSGVMFPQQWEESMRRHPILAQHTFELQGFGVLFSYLLCQLAAVETALTDPGTRDECDNTSAAGNPTPEPEEETKTNASEITSDVLRPECAQRNSAENCVTTSLMSETAPSKERRMSLNVLNASPLVLTARNLQMQPVSTTQSSELGNAEKRFKRPSQMPSSIGSRRQGGRIQIGLPHVWLRRPDQGEVYGERLLNKDDGETPLKAHRNSAEDETPLSLHIRSITALSAGKKDEKMDVGTGSVGGRSAHPCAPMEMPSRVERCSERGRVLPSMRQRLSDRHNLLRVEKVEEEIQLKRLAKRYGVNNIVNYANRDLEDYRKNVQEFRDLIDAEDADSGDVEYVQ